MNEKTIITDVAELNEIGRSEEIDIIKDNKLLREVISEIKKVMRKKGLTSLSAPAIGYNKRIFCIDFSDKEIKTFVNPLITNSEGLEMSREICSSLPERQFIRPRNSNVDVIYQSPTGDIKNNRFKGLAAFVIQHEIDHLEGILLSDIGLEVEDDFDSATEEDRLKIVDMYLESLDLRQQDLNKHIEESNELNLLATRINFVEGLAKGKIKLETIEDDDVDTEHIS